MCGFINDSAANATRDFCPPDSVPINCNLSYGRAHRVHTRPKGESLPCHAADLEIAKMVSVFLFCFTWEPRSQELNGGHGWIERVDVMLSKVASV